MELAEGRVNRRRRANAGNLLDELLTKGVEGTLDRIAPQLLDEEKELFDDTDTDSSFSVDSDEETVDEIDSDFSDKEDSRDESEAEETEASVRREEWAERQKQRKKEKSAYKARIARSFGGKGGSYGSAGKSEGSGMDFRSAVRRRPAPTIPLEQRLREAVERGEAVRADDTLEQSPTGFGQPQRRRRVRQRLDLYAGSLCVEEQEAGHYLYAQPSQRVCYSSSVSVLQTYGSPVVVSFTKQLPRIFQ